MDAAWNGGCSVKRLIGLLVVLVLSACAPVVQTTPQLAAESTLSAAADEPLDAVPTEESMPAKEPPAESVPAQDDPPAPETLFTGAYVIGQPVLTDLFVSPSGDDTNDGLTAEKPLRTLGAAWSRVPEQHPLEGSGWRINLLTGEYPCEPEEPDNCQNYFSSRWGTQDFPIVIRAAEGPGTVVIRGGMEFSDVAYLYLLDLALAGGVPLPTNASGNNLLHLSSIDHLLLRGMTLQGPDCDNDGCNNLQEVLKVNQAQHLYVENSTIGGAWHSAVDYFSVQYGHFINNRVHTAGQWCMYLKGGSAYLRVEGNEFGPCQLGLQAGQSSNLAVMRAPWLHYEAYGIAVVNNLFHDLPGVALSVSGGYNILFAYNTLYRVGVSTDPGYPLFQLVPGERGCNATDELPDPQPICAELIGKGAWGPDVLSENTPAIPNRNIYLLNNLFYNPAPAQTLYSHFYAASEMDRPAGFQNLQDRITPDENVVIAGNVIWNGSQGHSLGFEEGTGCGPAHPTCSPEAIAAQNSINQVEPELRQPDGGDFHPLAGGNLAGLKMAPFSGFVWDSFAPPVPAWGESLILSGDKDGNSRGEADFPGAFTVSR
jgi:hypothetical protein